MNVTAVDVADIRIVPDTATVAVGGSRQLTAVVHDADGNALDGRPVTWSSSDRSRAVVEEDGRIVGVASGVVIISARSGSVRGRAQVTVWPGAAPAAPTNLRADEEGRDRIELRWNDNSNNEDQFVIERSAIAAGVWTFRVNMPPNTRTYLDTGLSRDTRYWYRVLACNARGCSASSVASERTSS